MTEFPDQSLSSHSVTQLLAEAGAGNTAASEQAIRAIYGELRQLAAVKLRQERSDHTLSSTALLHECYLRLMQGDPPLAARDRPHFFMAASEAMRRILIEYARRRAAVKRGGDRVRIALDSASGGAWDGAGADPRASQFDVMAVDEALAALARYDPLAAQLVKLRYFGGLEHAEAAEQLAITRRQADRLWVIARAYLYRHLA